MTTNNLHKTIFESCEDRKGETPLLLDLSEIESYADHIIVVSGTSDRQVKAIADHVLDMCFKQCSTTPLGVEGYETGLWVLIDFGHVVCHVFHSEVRDAYHIEDMWPKVRPITEESADSYFVEKKPQTRLKSSV